MTALAPPPAYYPAAVPGAAYSEAIELLMQARVLLATSELWLRYALRDDEAGRRLMCREESAKQCEAARRFLDAGLFGDKGPKQ